MTVLDEQPVLQDEAPNGAFCFDSFVARHSLRLRRVVARKTGDHHEAEEVLQEALLRAYQHRDAFVDDDGAAAWTTVVAQRLAVDRHRVARRSLTVAEVPEGRADRDTADVVIASSEARVALDVLANLPRRQAAILWAREVEGLSYAEIAARMELTEPTVRTVLSRGRQALRKEFVKRGHAVPAAGLVPFAPALVLLRGSEELGRPVRRLLEMKLLGAAAVVVLAAGAITAGAPWISAAEPDQGISPASGGSGLIQLPPAGTEPAAATGTAPAAGPAGAPAEPGGGAAPISRPQDPTTPVVPLPRTCAAGTVCVDDELPEGGDELVLDLPLPATPLGVHDPGLNTDHVASCKELPDTPLTTCTPDDAGASR